MNGSADRRLMRRALRLAERGRGRVAPNPMVGAVVVRDGVVLGEGWHEEYGAAHAEVNALRAAGEAARGATLYVTLEPCAHHGRTPPCTDAILAAGVREVVYAASDPNPRAAGGGNTLRAHGVQVRGGVEHESARRLDPAFFHGHEHADCYVALKLALSLDAKLSRTRDERTRLTSPPADRAVHRLRAGFDAIMVGSGTVRADDPLLTVRGAIRPRVAPRRIVLDTAAALSGDSRLAATAAETPVWLFCAENADPARRAALEERGVRVLPVAAASGGLSLDAVFDALWKDGIVSVLCEGGATLAGALLRAGRVRRQYLVYVPRILGSDAVAAFDLHGSDAGAHGWRPVHVQRFGQDVVLVLDRTED